MPVSYWSTTALAVVIGVVCTLPPHPDAQEAEDLRAKAQNPVASMISLPLENNIDFGAPNGTAYVLNVQPVIPFNIGDWNLITRTIVAIASVKDLGKGSREPGGPGI